MRWGGIIAYGSSCCTQTGHRCSSRPRMVKSLPSSYTPRSRPMASTTPLSRRHSCQASQSILLRFPLPLDESIYGGWNLIGIHSRCGRWVFGRHHPHRLGRNQSKYGQPHGEMPGGKLSHFEGLGDVHDPILLDRRLSARRPQGGSTRLCIRDAAGDGDRHVRWPATGARLAETTLIQAECPERNNQDGHDKGEQAYHCLGAVRDDRPDSKQAGYRYHERYPNRARA